MNRATRRLPIRKRISAHADAYAAYFFAYVDRLSDLERESVYSGELDLTSRNDWEPPTLEEFGLADFDLDLGLMG